MMRDARYAQKRHTSYLQAHTDAIILFLLKNKRNRLILTQIVNKNKPRRITNLFINFKQNIPR